MGIERRFAVAAAWFGSLIAGCAVGPDFHRPQVDAPPAWSPAASAAASPDASSRLVAAPFDGSRWWTMFHDPLLDRLIDEAAAQNIDLQTAALRIASARVQREAAGGAGYPQVAGSAVAGRTRMSSNGIAGALGGGSGSSGAGGASGGASGGSGSEPSIVTNVFQLGFDASWELDLWGKVRRNVEAADAQVDVAEEQRHAAVASLGAEIARTYLGLRGNERQLTITRADIATQRRIGELVDSRWHAGLAAESEVAAQSSQLQSALAQLPTLEQNLAQARNRLALLLALPPGALEARLRPVATPADMVASSSSAAPFALPAEVPIGLPGDLLRRRPDVRRSEAELHAATARVGVATAGLFPSVTLGLGAGFQASSPADLTDWASRFFLGGAAVSIPIFQGGQLKAQVRLADLASQQAALNYRQTVLGAYHEADDALVAYGEEQRRAAALALQLGDARRSRELALGRWRNGLAAFTEVLDAERNAHQAELQLVQSQVTESTNLIAIVKALGGGWEEGGHSDTGVGMAPGARPVAEASALPLASR